MGLLELFLDLLLLRLEDKKRELASKVVRSEVRPLRDTMDGDSGALVWYGDREAVEGWGRVGGEGNVDGIKKRGRNRCIEVAKDKLRQVGPDMELAMR